MDIPVEKKKQVQISTVKKKKQMKYTGCEKKTYIDINFEKEQWIYLLRKRNTCLY